MGIFYSGLRTRGGRISLHADVKQSVTDVATTVEKVEGRKLRSFQTIVDESVDSANDDEVAEKGEEEIEKAEEEEEEQDSCRGNEGELLTKVYNHLKEMSSPPSATPNSTGSATAEFHIER